MPLLNTQFDVSSGGRGLNIGSHPHARIQRWEEHGVRPPEKSQKYRVSQQYWSGSSENYTAAFNVGPSSVRQRNAISLLGR